MENEQGELLSLAKTIVLPEWATHVAVATTKTQRRAFPCAWMESEGEYVDEDPDKLKKGDWAASFKTQYWEFFSRNQLKGDN